MSSVSFHQIRVSFPGTVNQDFFPPQNLLPGDGEARYFGVRVGRQVADDWLSRLQKDIPWENDVVKMFGKTIVTARKMAWFGDEGLDYTYSGSTKTPRPWTALLNEIKKFVEHEIGGSFNSCLLNYYHDGSQGMSWHRDNESSIVRNSTIACISLGAKRRFHFKNVTSKERITIELEHGSLLEMAGAIQTFWLHSLPKSTRIADSRISLTFRRMKTRPE